MSGIRVRFAPSPTGYLHVGGARTALFNWLYARKTGGTFVLRIEDTDVERSSGDMVEGILEGLRWLGIDWDEGPGVGGPHAPYFQSQRLDRYRAVAHELVASDHAYFCYCDAEALKAKREEAQARGEDGRYDRTCLSRGQDELDRFAREGRPRAIRFKVPDGATSFADLVHGEISFEHPHIEDFVLLRSDGHPTYQLTVVVDDVDMDMSHVIRGDDHISNTPKQVLLYQAMGHEVPRFAHVPLILGPDKKRLSKRHGATSVTEYKTRGYLPEAMVNFLALLGWSPGTDEEVLGRDDLIARFTLEGISGGNAVFNPDKLEWFNGQHLQRLANDVLAGRLQPMLEAHGVWQPGLASERASWFNAVLDLLKPRARMLADLADAALPFLAESVEMDEAAAKKHLQVAGIGGQLEALASAYRALEPFDQAALERTLRATADTHGSKAGPLIHATRVAVTGRAVSPGLFEVLELVGRDRVVTRLKAAAAMAVA
jgi:glutamyl-tRNA synthetase